LLILEIDFEELTAGIELGINPRIEPRINPGIELDP
jgi:hypothetical protein